MHLTPRATRPTAARLVVVGLLVASALAIDAAPAVATITGVNPRGATVEPGQGASATVSMSSQGVPPSCVTASAPTAVTAAVSHPCGEGSWSTRLTVGTTSSTPPGVYTVTLTERDKTGSTTGSATFTLTVRGPDPTTTTARPTTTRPSTTARPTPSEPPATEAPPAEPATTAAPTTTTEPARGVSLAAIAARTLPERVLFLPFPGDGRARCVPLEEPCVDPDFRLVVAPAEGRELAWVPAVATPSSSDDAHAFSVAAVDVDPATLPSSAFVVAGIDARPAGGRLELLHRVAADGAAPVLVPGAAPPDAAALTATLRPPAPAPPEPLLASTLFDQPAPVRSDDLIDARPAVVVFGPGSHVVAGIIADPAWRLDGPWLPLLQATGIAHLARLGDGRVGLAVPTNIAPITRASIEIVNESRPTGWPTAAALLFGAAALIAGGGIIYSVRRR